MRDIVQEQLDNMPFPDAKSFSDLFADFTPYDHKFPLQGRREWSMVADQGTTNVHTQGNVITSYCAIQARRGDSYHPSLHVLPKPEVTDYIRNNMIQVDYDHIYFNVVIRSDGTALITASYNQILGSRWLAVVDANTVPNVLEAAHVV